MASKHFFIFSLVFLTTATFLLAGQCSAHDPKVSTALSSLCSDADFPQLCLEITKGASDPKSATQMAIQALILGATGLQKSNLDTCVEVYDDAVDNLHTSLANIQSGDKAALKSNLSAVLSDIVTCDDSFAEGGDDPPAALTKTNKVMRKLGSNCLALADEVHF
ncbi:hypothetical protein PVL29_000721 [Vitis rotundifolia]|uniref:Pectinesterase inhibitor domain-containing protein n=1 Tax=Vitis rotundifolia TaxID=103349 RepID=A0AA39AJQ2_VITRO|nr:hypothetical protein PVL29_000721 [Vitis rotundifolia]